MVDVKRGWTGVKKKGAPKERAGPRMVGVSLRVMGGGECVMRASTPVGSAIFGGPNARNPAKDKYLVR